MENVFILGVGAVTFRIPTLVGVSVPDVAILRRITGHLAHLSNPVLAVAAAQLRNLSRLTAQTVSNVY